MRYYKVRFSDDSGNNVHGNAYIYSYDDGELAIGDVVELPSSRQGQDNPHGVVVEADVDMSNVSFEIKQIVKKVG